ncbi:kinesin-like protein KIN-14G [Helianthus annuus]|uniref:kinesin-like protein KIN-14G n=1 Tax=Helianthus annuus TaxID=4232 RepID=UPI00165317BD|nr:kinesin-like protein KIN-14G [Helianthus annuus]
MVVHKRPELDYVGETVSTLEFVERVAIVEFGAARGIERVVCNVFIIHIAIVMDQRGNYEQTEPATYNNAPLLGVLARFNGGHFAIISFQLKFLFINLSMFTQSMHLHTQGT